MATILLTMPLPKDERLDLFPNYLKITLTWQAKACEMQIVLLYLSLTYDFVLVSNSISTYSADLANYLLAK